MVRSPLVWNSRRLRLLVSMRAFVRKHKLMLAVLCVLQALFFDFGAILPASELKDTRSNARVYALEFTVCASVEENAALAVNEVREVCVNPQQATKSVCVAPRVSAMSCEVETFSLSDEEDTSKEAEYQSLQSSHVDPSYKGQVVTVTGYDRQLLECLVFGEAGGEGFYGQALVAQAIRDTMLMDGISSIQEVISKYKYSGSTKKGTSDSVKEAVKFIFDEGNYVVQHRVIYFYAPKYCSSSFHESQEFIIEYGGHRFFDDVTK